MKLKILFLIIAISFGTLFNVPFKNMRPKWFSQYYRIYNIVSKYRYVTPKDCHLIAVYIQKYSKKYNLPINLTLAIIQAESNFDKKAKSKKGCIGLMQLSPYHCKYILRTDKIDNKKKVKQLKYNTKKCFYDIEININVGCYIIKSLFNKYHIYEYVLIAYAYRDGHSKIMDCVLNNISPYKYNHIKKVLNNFKKIPRINYNSCGGNDGRQNKKLNNGFNTRFL